METEVADENKSKNADLHHAAQQLGHAGGVVGGPARARKLTAAERSEIARKAAKARWAKAEMEHKKPSQNKKPKPTKPPKVKKEKKVKAKAEDN